MDELMQYLVTQFGVEHDIRFTPSVIIGGGFMFRCTVSNLPHKLNSEYSIKASSYERALSIVVSKIKQDLELNHAN